MQDLDEILEHHGIKGMKWGVRKKGPKPTGPAAVTTKVTPGKKVQTSGGERQKPHEDAVTAAIARQKARKSSTDSLSDAELKKLIGRMQMEQQYSQLAAARQNKGKKFLVGMLSSVGKQQAQGVANQYASAQIAKLMAKGAVGA